MPNLTPQVRRPFASTLFATLLSVALVIASGTIAQRATVQLVQADKVVENTHVIIAQLHALEPLLLAVSPAERERQFVKRIAIIEQHAIAPIQIQRIKRLKETKDNRERLFIIRAMDDTSIELLQLRRAAAVAQAEQASEYITVCTTMSAGLILGMAITMLHFTKRQQEARDEISQREVRYRTLVKTSILPIITATLDKATLDAVIVIWNDGAQRVFGYTEQEVLGTSLTVLMPERFREAHQRGVLRVAQGIPGRVLNTTLRHEDAGLMGLHKDRREFPIDLTIVQWQAGEDTFFTGIIHPR